MLDINTIINEEIDSAYKKGRRDVAKEIKDIFSKRNPNGSNQYEIEVEMLDKLFEELNNSWV